MKIVTVNVPEKYLEAIDKLINLRGNDEKNGTFPSRSELVRAAVRQFLMSEINIAKNMLEWKEPENPEIEDFDDKNFVRIPVQGKDDNGEPITEFKTYKILREA